ncbi:hypothetical protein C475_01771 [Halosimplex carlsbadense 2-9-1]|uniref:Protein-glutamine gamma-glutamyltransferase-like C-terminal domain-containing protein n=1 Tax=Halosimplex carlsbadense 2-9-1 TaxID=797114 RepID=M0D4M7_9EURY|nr:DUF4129 domain-containing protein [Halosimplex carlsbadense]ELZ29637.1 hypothetical protein C475_01771 [Halosimplex carlsbadense 2-9-1]
MIGRSVGTALLIAAAVVGLGAVAAVDPGNPAEGVDRERNESIVERQPFTGGGSAGGFYIDLPVSIPGSDSIPFPGPALVLTALAAAAAALWYQSDTDVSLEALGDDDEAERVGGGDVDLSAVGRTAGAAADRIDADADVDNEVYRAWDEMRAHVDAPDAETKAPAEFADAAAAAGMDPDDVAELTELFVEVRYGGRDPADRADRAIAALRRIETAYADDGPGPEGDER